MCWHRINWLTLETNMFYVFDFTIYIYIYIYIYLHLFYLGFNLSHLQRKGLSNKNMVAQWKGYHFVWFPYFLISISTTKMSFHFYITTVSSLWYTLKQRIYCLVSCKACSQGVSYIVSGRQSGGGWVGGSMSDKACYRNLPRSYRYVFLSTNAGIRPLRLNWV